MAYVSANVGGSGGKSRTTTTPKTYSPNTYNANSSTESAAEIERKRKVEEYKKLVEGIKKVGKQALEANSELSSLKRDLPKLVTGTLLLTMQKIIEKAQEGIEDIIINLNGVNARANEKIKENGGVATYDSLKLDYDAVSNAGGNVMFSCDTDLLRTQIETSLRKAESKLVDASSTSSSLPKLEGCEDVNNVPSTIQDEKYKIQESQQEIENLIERVEKVEKQNADIIGNLLNSSGSILYSLNKEKTTPTRTVQTEPTVSTRTTKETPTRITVTTPTRTKTKGTKDTSTEEDKIIAVTLSNTETPTHITVKGKWEYEPLKAYKGYMDYYTEDGQHYYETYCPYDVSQLVINMQKIDGIYFQQWTRDDGVQMYGPYVMVAADVMGGNGREDKGGSEATYRYGDIVETSLGTGMVVDFCEEATNKRKYGKDGVIHYDIYTIWQTDSKFYEDKSLTRPEEAPDADEIEDVNYSIEQIQDPDYPLIETSDDLADEDSDNSQELSDNTESPIVESIKET